MPKQIIRFDPIFEVEVSNIVTIRIADSEYSIYQRDWEQLVAFVAKNLEPARKRQRGGRFPGRGEAIAETGHLGADLDF